MMDDVFMNGINRRNFIRLSAGAATAAAMASLVPIKAKAAKISENATRISLQDCLRLTPADMAKTSPQVQTGYDYLLKSCKHIQRTRLRSVITDGLINPMPKLMELYPSEDEKTAVRQQLTAAGYLKGEVRNDQLFPPCNGPEQNVQPFYTTPGSGWKSHHAYPGGLVTHVATNLQAGLGIADSYRNIFGYDINRELLVAGVLLHDMQKTWVFQWKEDLSWLPELYIAGVGVHHVLAIADAMHRGLPPEVIVIVACSHEHPGNANTEGVVINWIKAAGMIAKQDPVQMGLLSADGKTLPLPRRQEGFLVHLGDHDFVLASPLSVWMTSKLTEIARQEYKMTDEELKGKPFNALRNYLFSQVGDMKLHQLWADSGEAALREAIKNVVIL